MASPITAFTDYPGFVTSEFIPPDPSLTPGHLLLHIPGKRDGMRVGNQIPNLAAASAQTIVGTPVLASTFFNTFSSAASGVVEWTPKDRAHIMVSKQNNTSTGATGLGAGAGLQMTTNLKDYLQANPTHKYYVSIGFKLTRDYSATSPTLYPLAGIKSPSSLTGSRIYGGVTATGAMSGVPTGGSQRLGFTADFLPADQSEKFIAISADGFTLSTAVSTILMYLGAWDSATQNRAPSIVWGRLALVDLTVSGGLSHSVVASADRAAWSASLSVGGYYYGDTNSDPAVVVP